jgi:hypothetical protein
VLATSSSASRYQWRTSRRLSTEPPLKFNSGRGNPLDRVVCCYPSYEALLNPALRHAEKCFALSYPRDVWYVRLGVLLENAHRRLTKNPFRTYVHPAARMEDVIRSAGFELSTRRETWMWSVDVYTRHGQKH